MTTPALSPDLLPRVLDVLERLPMPVAAPVPTVTADHLRACVQAHCDREGLTVTPADLDQAVEAHLNAHPLMVRPVVAPPAPTPPVVRVARPRGWRRPRSAFTLWLRQHSPEAAWRALTDRMQEGRRGVDIFVYAYAVALLLWSPVWLFPMPLPIRLVLGVLAGFIATMCAGIEDYAVARSMERQGRRWGPKQSDPLADAGSVREPELARWQDTPEVLAYVQACLHSRIPRLLVGDMRHIQRMRERQQQAKHLAQQKAQVAMAIQKAQSAA